MVINRGNESKGKSIKKSTVALVLVMALILAIFSGCDGEKKSGADSKGGENIKLTEKEKSYIKDLAEIAELEDVYEIEVIIKTNQGTEVTEENAFENESGEEESIDENSNADNTGESLESQDAERNIEYEVTTEKNSTTDRKIIAGLARSIVESDRNIMKEKAINDYEVSQYDKMKWEVELDVKAAKKNKKAGLSQIVIKDKKGNTAILPFTITTDLGGYAFVGLENVDLMKNPEARPEYDSFAKITPAGEEFIKVFALSEKPKGDMDKKSVEILRENGLEPSFMISERTGYRLPDTFKYSYGEVGFEMHWQIINLNSKAIGLDLTKYQGKKVDIEKYLIRQPSYRSEGAGSIVLDESDMEKYKNDNNAVYDGTCGYIIKYKGDIIGAFISGFNSSYIGALNEKTYGDYDVIYGKKTDENRPGNTENKSEKSKKTKIIELDMKAPSKGQKELAKLTPEEIIKMQFYLLDSKNNKDVSGIAKKEKIRLSDININNLSFEAKIFPSKGLRNVVRGVMLTKEEMEREAEKNDMEDVGIEMAKLIYVKPISYKSDIPENKFKKIESFEVKGDYLFENPESVESGNGKIIEIYHMEYLGKEYGWKINSIGF